MNNTRTNKNSKKEAPKGSTAEQATQDTETVDDVQQDKEIYVGSNLVILPDGEVILDRSLLTDAMVDALGKLHIMDNDLYVVETAYHTAVLLNDNTVILSSKLVNSATRLLVKCDEIKTVAYENNVILLKLHNSNEYVLMDSSLVLHSVSVDDNGVVISARQGLDEHTTDYRKFASTDTTYSTSTSSDLFDNMANRINEPVCSHAHNPTNRSRCNTVPAFMRPDGSDGDNSSMFGM